MADAPDDAELSTVDKLAVAWKLGLMNRPGDGNLTFDPLLTPDECRLVLEGFDDSALDAQPRSRRKLTESQVAEIEARLNKGETYQHWPASSM